MVCYPYSLTNFNVICGSLVFIMTMATCYHVYRGERSAFAIRTLAYAIGFGL